MRFSIAWCVALSLLACGDDASPDVGVDAGVDASCTPGAPGDGTLILGAAGAPEALFGPESNPAFDAAFQQLADVGFDAFFPFFGRSEIEGVADVSRHFEFFVSAGLGGRCTSNNPYTAARGSIRILYPAFLFSDADLDDRPFTESVFRQRFDHEMNTCWGGDDEIVLAYESFDEIASQRVVQEFFGNPGPRVANAPAAAALLNELSDKPVILVEGPADALIRAEPLPMEQRDELLEVFWNAVDVSVMGLDYYGFDVYPVPNDPPTLSGDYVRTANERAPGTQRLAVLQGFSREAESRGMIPGRGPDAEESWFMALDAIVGGATMLIWYGGSYLRIEDEPDEEEIWQTVTDTVTRLGGIRPYLSGPTVAVDVDGVAEAVAFQYDERSIAVVVSHRSAEPAELTLTLPDGYDAGVDEDGIALEMSDNTLPMRLGELDARFLRFVTCE